MSDTDLQKSNIDIKPKEDGKPNNAEPADEVLSKDDSNGAQSTPKKESRQDIKKSKPEPPKDDLPKSENLTEKEQDNEANQQNENKLLKQEKNQPTSNDDKNEQENMENQEEKPQESTPAANAEQTDKTSSKNNDEEINCVQTEKNENKNDADKESAKHDNQDEKPQESKQPKEDIKATIATDPPQKNDNNDNQQPADKKENSNVYAYGDASANNFAYADAPKQEPPPQPANEEEKKEIIKESVDISNAANDNKSVPDGNVEDKAKVNDNNQQSNKLDEKKEDTNIYAYGAASVNDFAYGDAPKEESKPTELEQDPVAIEEIQISEIAADEEEELNAEEEEEKEEIIDEAPPTAQQHTSPNLKPIPPNTESLSLSPMSPRVTARKEMIEARRRFDGNGLPLVICLRCDNSFFVEKRESHFTATARQRNLKFAFTFVPDPIEDDIYNIIHIQSACYLSVKKIGSSWTLYPVNNDDILNIPREDLSFSIIKISNNKEVNLRVTIGWKGKFLTLKEAVLYSPSSSPNKLQLPQISEQSRFQAMCEGDDIVEELPEDEKQQGQLGDTVALKDIAPTIAPFMTEQDRTMSRLDGTDMVLVFEEAYTENIDQQVFILERIMEDTNDDDVDLLFLLDLVDQGRPEKIGKPRLNLKKYKHIPPHLSELIQQIYVRLDENKTGYAGYDEVWTQFVQYSQGMVPRAVITAFEDAIGKCEFDVSKKLIHIKNFVATVDTIIELYKNEIKMEELELLKEKELKKRDPIDIKLRRLDSDILEEHPFLQQWQKMSWTRRKMYDWRIWFYNKWTTRGDEGFFLWRKHLVNIQSNFGESIFAFFQFTRWLMMLNLIMALFYGVLIFAHAWNFSFSSYSVTEYIDMAFGNEYQASWWFYGAYKPKYPGSMVTFDIGFAWVAVSVAATFISVVAVLKVLLNAGVADDDEYIFSRNVFSNYDHSLKHKDAITLQTNSIMIQLHETLLDKIDDETSKLTCVLFMKRVIGVLLCVIVGAVSAAGIMALIYYEEEVILPKVEDWHRIFKSVSPYIVPAGVAVIKSMTPYVVRAIVAFENYSAAILFQQTFFRVFLLRIFAILVTLFQTSQTAEDSENLAGKACAESQIGMVLYKFIIFDMVLEIMFYFVIPSTKYCCGRICGSIKNLSAEEALKELNRKITESFAAADKSNDNKKKKQRKTEFELAGDSWKSQFDIPGGLVDVMYRQGIVWSGMFFSPMIPVMAVIASIVTFFIKKRFLFLYCGRPKKALGVTKQLKFFYGMMLLAIITSLVPLNYFLGRTPNCGPHQQEKVLDETEETLDDDMPSFLRVFFQYAFNGLLLMPLLILTWVYLGYVRGVRNVHETNAKQLKERLLKEKNEKKQILKDYNIRL